MKGTIVVSPVQFHGIHLTHQGICGECLLTASRHHLLQIPSAMLLSLAYGGNMFRSALSPYAAMLNIYMTAAVADTIAVPIWMRCIAAVFTVSGTIVGGARMISVTGDTCSAGTPQLVNLPCLLSLDSTRVVDRASNWTQMAASMMVPSRAGRAVVSCSWHMSSLLTHVLSSGVAVTCGTGRTHKRLMVHWVSVGSDHGHPPTSEMVHLACSSASFVHATPAEITL